ncbi:undecaprenyl-diphosphatase [Lishizhenia tianjinensis]|uniref:Undecaprenyl-diphosphatase n=1 Tax=Lishizhenia tianjinensis TaxID=477690 RepID=A0A1I7B579_9FLAO|nr:undecaprenyl-diphosphate phosphatase [Lishizhenia tianjinensis]SFT82327.1 undecaprenyl-diphosphatase [Lishizhenia tianjinensis]
MDILDAIILGLIQGLTEFLPVSSSGHIFLGQVMMQKFSEEPLLFTIVLHLATALSTVVIFWKDIISIFKGLFQFKNNAETKFSLYIVLSMIPAGIVGLTLDDLIDSITQKDNQYFGLIIVGACLLFTAALLYFTEKSKTQTKEINAKNAFIIGVAQAIAVLPGISRSGSTIATGILLGVNREKMARFSFLMVLPLIVGAMLKKGKDYIDAGGENTIETLPLIVGFIVAFFTGLVACKWMIALVKKAKLTSFAIYCAAAGIVAISYSLFFV